MQTNQDANNWYKQNSAKHLLYAEYQQLNLLIQQLNGEQLLFLSDLWAKEIAKVSTFKHKWAFAPSAVCEEIDTVIGSYEEWPFLSDSMDLIILPHIIDKIKDKRLIVNELWRVLQPEGIALIMGFNSNSIYGMPEYLKGNSNLYINSMSHMKNKLISRGFSIELAKSFYFQPKKIQNTRNKLNNFFEILGQFLWPTMGTAYLFKVKKPVLGMNHTPEKIKFKKLAPTKGLAEPT